MAITVAALGLVPSAHATFPGDNGRIAFTWSAGGEAFESGPRSRPIGVFSIRPDGTERRLIARGAREPVYSPNGKRIAFLRSQRLWVADADGSRAQPVTPRGWAVGQQRWSPRGTRLLFERAFENSVRTVLYTVAPDGDLLNSLVRAPMPLSLSSGAWSPDGRAVVYGQSRLRGSIVRVVRAGAVTTLARGSHPAWSRRGLIAFEARRPGSSLDRVCTVRFATDAEPDCMGFDDAGVGAPVWSPDGRRLMVTYTPRTGGRSELWIVAPDGTVLTRAPAAEAPPSVFSPNGRRLAYARPRITDGLQYTDLFLRRADGSGTRLLVRGGQAQHPDWQPRP